MTDPNNQPELSPQVAATVAKLRAILDQIADLTVDAELYKAQLREALQPGAYTVGGQAALSITQTRKFSPERAAEMLPPDALAAVTRTVTVVDAKLAKEMLPPALYQLCTAAGGKATVKTA